MSDDEAMKILETADFISNSTGKPHWMIFERYMNGEEVKDPVPTVCLDGDFTRDQLLAILHFHPSTHV